jgi:CDGSH-type Zn-finger protein
MALKIIVRENGPFAVDLSTGDLLLVDHLGNEIPLPQPKPGKTTITLCRCGASSNKPFCDSTHSKIGFKGANEAARHFDEQQSQQPPKEG